MRVASDVGGTFTDLVCIEGGTIRTVKADTTPPNFERGVLNAIDKGGLDPKSFTFFAHGTTVVINALLSRKGARAALVTRTIIFLALKATDSAGCKLSPCLMHVDCPWLGHDASPSSMRFHEVSK